MEKWLYQHSMKMLCQSTHIGEIEGAISFIEDIIDEIDDLNNDVRPLKDIISVSKSQYEESFPTISRVFDTCATESEIVTNFEFDQLPLLLKHSSIKNPVVITSVRKSDISNQLRFGKQYVVISADKDEIKIDYEHEGTGDFQIPSGVSTHLFTLRNLLAKRISSIECDICQK